jgi:DNA-3-methyladenine glycosylase
VSLRFQNRNLEHPETLLGRLLPRAFFEASPEQVAPRLLGKVLAHFSASGLLAGRIVEAEAYLGPHNDPPDPAAHAHRGPTPRNRVLFGPAAHAYVYAIYGRYFCMNIGCETEGRAGCVLLRALEPLAGTDQMALNRGLARRAGSSPPVQAGSARRWASPGRATTASTCSIPCRRSRCATTATGSQKCG